VGEATVEEIARAPAEPVPEVGASGSERPVGVLGDAWVVVERLEGETIPPRILRDDARAVARSRLTGQCGRRWPPSTASRPAPHPELERPDPQAHARHPALGVADDAELAAAIRTGSLEGRCDADTAAVRAAVSDELAVASHGQAG
jgi:hypothetical protein